MLGDQPGGEGVVGHDQLFAGLVHPAVGDHPARSSAWRTRSDSSAAALRVKVRPSTCSGGRLRCRPARPRAAITVVLPEPAPAMITPGSSGAVIAVQLLSGERDAERLDQVVRRLQPGRRGRG